MSRVRSKNTAPELAVRRLLASLGYRFRLHRRDLPGTPDIVFSGRRKVVFVHGCFWHGHARCRYGRTPKTRPEFWGEKQRRNAARDRATRLALRHAGWAVVTVWECELRRPTSTRLAGKLIAFLGDA